jgi:hypothetical protein
MLKSHSEELKMTQEILATGVLSVRTAAIGVPVKACDEGSAHAGEINSQI